jgi:hypothetical protein
MENERTENLGAETKNELYTAENGIAPSDSTKNGFGVALSAKQKHEEISGNLAVFMILSGMAAALLYTVCFAGVDVIPQIGFTVFCVAALIGVTVFLRRTRTFVNKKAYIWAIPIALAALSNGVFYGGLIYLNVFVMWFLFAAFILRATGVKSELCGVDFISRLFRALAGSPALTFAALTASVRIKKKSAVLSVVLRSLIGVFLCLPVLILIFALLASADPVFLELASRLGDKIFRLDFNVYVFMANFIFMFIYASAYVMNAVRVSKLPLKSSRAMNGDGVVGVTFLTLLNALFLVFSVVQFTFLFTGGYMRLPYHLTYAEYAHEGFFQLLAVTVINFCVILFFRNLVTKEGKKAMRFLLITLCVFTLVLTFSSFYRMGLYISAYGYTTLRLQVLTFLVMELPLLIVTILSLLSVKINLGRFYVATALVFYLIVNVSGSYSVMLRANKLWESAHPGKKPEYEGFMRLSGRHWQNFSLMRSLDGELEPALNNTEADYRFDWD